VKRRTGKEVVKDNPDPTETENEVWTEFKWLEI
jgi:hypothetical protein